MTLNEYQSSAVATAIYKDRGNNLVYPALKLAGEAGEVAEKVGKKLYRDGDGEITPEFKLELAKEIGDVVWYCAALADELSFTLDEVAEINLAKLRSRKERGVISGSGDNR